MIAITESWCSDLTNSATLTIPGFSLEIRLDRQDTTAGRGGGILVYVRTGLAILDIDHSDDFIQYCKFRIKDTSIKSCDLNVVVVYRSPNSSSANNTKLCHLINTFDKNTLVLGDFNYPNINWNTCVCDNSSLDFYNAVADLGFQQYVKFPTHKKGNILDLVLCNEPNVVLDVKDCNPLGKSDHHMLFVFCNFSYKMTETVEQVLDWRNADLQGLKLELSNFSWVDELDGKSTKESWQLFKTKIGDLTLKYVPTKLRRKHSKPIWMNQNVMRVIRKKKRLFKYWKTTKDYESYANYKKSEKLVQKTVKNAKKKFEQKLSRKNRNDKSFYSYVSSRTKSKSNVGPIKKSDGSVTNDDKEVCDLLNSYFSSVFSAEGDGPVPTLSRLPCNETLTDVNFSEEAIEAKINKLKPGCAPGPDRITEKILKEVKEYITLPLSIIFTRSLQEGTVPEDWRLANVTPIFKKGAKTSVSNYRPVSLTSLVCKIMESILRDNITEHLLSNKLISSSQHGFMKSKSCLTNLLEFLETLTSLHDEGYPSDLIFLDFSKAFDKVPKKRLIEKMKAHSIDGKVLYWIEAWLTNRKQRVVLNGKVSQWELVESGVPQGSVLGPTLFVIFINDIDSLCTLITIIKKFADDTKLGQKVTSIEDRDKLQKCLDDLYTWADTWGMLFNVDKCKVMHIGHNNPEYIYTMNDSPLHCVPEEKDIGVYLNSNLKPSLQCKKAVNKAMRALFCLTKAFHYRDKVTFVNLYKTYVRPHLEFSVPAWCPWTRADIELIERVQRKMVRMVSGLLGTSYEEKLFELNLISLQQRRERQDMIETFKIVHGFSNVESSTWFDFMSETSTRTTRLSSEPLTIRVKYSRTEIRKNFFSTRVVNPWNNLPAELKQSRSIKLFKSSYDCYIQTQ